MKRGSSGLSLVVGIFKEINMSSHDVVNRCRKVFSERRVGHAGTLDPAASGVLLVCVGPATRLNPYLTSQEKSYRFKVCFGSATDTDDAEGSIIEQKPVPQDLYEYHFAQTEVAQLIGKSEQMPPAYSAIKVAGKRAYEAARSGSELKLKLREIEVFESELLSIEEDSDHRLSWEIALRVSKGTYIRSIARDLGKKLGTCAHVTELERTASGLVTLDDCASLAQLKESPDRYVLDPVPLLGFKVALLAEGQAEKIRNGTALRGDSLLLTDTRGGVLHDITGNDTPGILLDNCGMKNDELVSVVAGRKLLALYGYDIQTHTLQPRCVFSTGVLRGLDH